MKTTLNIDDHFHHSDEDLKTLLLSNRKEVLSLLRKLFGKGLGFIDNHLLAAVMIHHVPIWTRNKSLKKVAIELGISY